MYKLDIINFYKTGNNIIDNNIKKLINITNKLIAYINKGACAEEISNIIFLLIFYAQENIKNKEKILRNNNKFTDDIKTHHKNFTNKILEYKNAFANGEKNICIDIYKFLILWINNENKINKQIF